MPGLLLRSSLAVSWVGFVVCRDTLIQNMHPAAYTGRAVVMLLWWALKPTSPQCWKQPSQLKTKVSALTANRTRSSGDNKVFLVDKPFLLRNAQKSISFQHSAEDRMNYMNDAKHFHKWVSSFSQTVNTIMTSSVWLVISAER